MRKIYLFLLLILCFGNLSAQWTYNTKVNTEVSNTVSGDALTIACSDGKTWYAWSKNVPAPNYFEMRAQLLDKDGVKLLGPEGILVNNAQEASFTTFFSVAVDANNNLLVGFTSNFNQNSYINKINQAGNQLWGNTGYVIPNSLLPRMTVLPNNDVIVSWLDQNVGTRGYMQRLNATTGTKVWAADVPVLPIVASQKTANGYVLPLSNNDFIHVFHNRGTTNGVTSTMWVQRYNANGIAQWAQPVQISDKGTAYNRFYYPIMDKDTLFLGYMGSTGARLDCFVQRINPDGTLPWGINGSDFATDNTYFEGEIRIAVAPATNVVWAASMVETTSQGLIGTYVQKFQKQSGLRQLTDNGKVVYPILAPPYVQPFAISLFSDNLPVLMLGKYSSFSDNKIYATKLDNNGNFVWPGDTVALGTFVKDKLRMDMSNVVNDQAVAFWVETKGTFDQPYAQNIRSNGTTGLIAPVANFTANTTTICKGNAVQYTSSSTGYVGAYFWTFPGGTPATSTLANPLITYATNGTYDVTLAVANSAGNNSLTQSNYITVNGLTVTSALSGNVSGCANSINLFTANGTNLGNAPTYSWTVNGAAIANTASTYTFTNAAAGTYLISCNVTSNAVCASPATVTTNTISYVNNSIVTPTATLTGNTIGCEANASTFVASGTNLGATPTYVWKVNNNTVSNTSNSYSFASTPGTYQINYIVTSNAQCVSSATATSNVINYVVSAYPQISLSAMPSSMCKSDAAFTLSATPVGGTFTVNGTAATIFNPAALGTGTYTIVYSVASNGCTSTLTKTIQVNECAERHLQLNQPGAIILLKNPNNGNFGLQVKSDLITKLNIRTFNKLGQLINKNDVSNLTYGTIIPMNITSSAAGAYYVNIINNENGASNHKTFNVIKY